MLVFIFTSKDIPDDSEGYYTVIKVNVMNHSWYIRHILRNHLTERN